MRRDQQPKRGACAGIGARTPECAPGWPPNRGACAALNAGRRRLCTVPRVKDPDELNQCLQHKVGEVHLETSSCSLPYGLWGGGAVLAIRLLVG